MQVRASDGRLWWYKAEALCLPPCPVPSMWRDQDATAKYCSRPSDEEGPLCCHGDDVIRTNHWNCCGGGERAAACSRGSVHHFLGTGSGAATFYCARIIGRDRLPGSDGQCGPNNGPQCADCRAYQVGYGSPSDAQLLALARVD